MAEARADHVADLERIDLKASINIQYLGMLLAFGFALAAVSAGAVLLALGKTIGGFSSLVVSLFPIVVGLVLRQQSKSDTPQSEKDTKSDDH